MFDDKVLLITGGTGSFGNAVLRRFLDTDIAEIRIFSRDEKKQDDMRKAYNHPKLKFYIGDVRDYQSVLNSSRGVDFIYHAAALKQVPSCEFHPMEAVKTNVIGTENVLEAAIQNEVKRVVCLSTDKAVYPINAMGISKAMMEKVMVAKSRNLDENKTVICGTRYGNVMASRGSVIPLFVDQIRNGKPITITDPNMTRFMITLEQGVELVWRALSDMVGGEIYVKKIPSMNILDVAHAISCDVQTKIVGIRPGEKLHESMISVDDSLNTYDFEDYYVISPSNGSLRFETDFKKNELNKGYKGIVDYGFEYNSGKNDRFLTISELKELKTKFQNQN